MSGSGAPEPYKGLPIGRVTTISVIEQALPTAANMPLRDYLAARASDLDVHNHIWAKGSDKPRTREQAKYAYADAMMKARKA